jgi:hypothetical protein
VEFQARIPASSLNLTLSVQQCRPHFADSEGTDETDLSRLNHAASVPATYASSGALPHPHARLASGRWLALAGRESNPLDSIEKFPSATSDFLLSQIYPGATAEVPHTLYVYLMMNRRELRRRNTDQTCHFGPRVEPGSTGGKKTPASCSTRELWGPEDRGRDCDMI